MYSIFNINGIFPCASSDAVHQVISQVEHVPRQKSILLTRLEMEEYALILKQFMSTPSVNPSYKGMLIPVVSEESLKGQTYSNGEIHVVLRHVENGYKKDRTSPEGYWKQNGSLSKITLRNGSVAYVRTVSLKVKGSLTRILEFTNSRPDPRNSPFHINDDYPDEGYTLLRHYLNDKKVKPKEPKVQPVKKGDITPRLSPPLDYNPPKPVKPIPLQSIPQHQSYIPQPTSPHQQYLTQLQHQQENSRITRRSLSSSSLISSTTSSTIHPRHPIRLPSSGRILDSHIIYNSSPHPYPYTHYQLQQQPIHHYNYSSLQLQKSPDSKMGIEFLLR